MPSTLPLSCPPIGGIEIEMSNLVLPGGDAVINSAVPFNMNVTFTLGGILVPFLQTFSIPLSVGFFFESIGPGAELNLGIVNFNVNAGFVPSVICVNPTTFDYILTLIVPIGTLPLGVAGKTAAVMTPTFPVIAHTDGPVISST